MAQSVLQLQVLKQGGPLTPVTVPYPMPDHNEVTIRVKAIAINPLDWKARYFGVQVQEWPVVLGLDASGIIESVGSSVRNFKTGDEVFGLAGMNRRSGAYQEVITVPVNFVARKPKTLTFEEAASLPTCYIAATAAILDGFHVHLPYLNNRGSSDLQSILVIGGSSGVGASAIQLLRLALPSATILTTSSAKHHTHLISLGATKCFERSAQNDPSVIKVATPEGSGVDAILDTVQAAASEPAIFGALNPSGPRLYSQIMTGTPVDAPEGVQSIIIFGRKILDSKYGSNAIPVLTNLIEEAKFKLPTKVEIVGQGWDAVEGALEKNKNGVSGAKYVVTV